MQLIFHKLCWGQYHRYPEMLLTGLIFYAYPPHSKTYTHTQHSNYISFLSRAGHIICGNNERSLVKKGLWILRWWQESVKLEACGTTPVAHPWSQPCFFPFSIHARLTSTPRLWHLLFSPLGTLSSWLMSQQKAAFPDNAVSRSSLFGHSLHAILLSFQYLPMLFSC